MVLTKVYLYDMDGDFIFRVHALRLKHYYLFNYLYSLERCVSTGK